MKTHTTNYFNTFISVAEDTKASQSSAPKAKDGAPSVAQQQFELLAGHPYRYTSDEVLFRVHAMRQGIDPNSTMAREEFFSKGQPCLRTSPLAKTYGFGIHCNAEGKVALVGMETKDYEKLLADDKITKVRAMRSSRK